MPNPTITILVVDDQDSSRQYLQAQLAYLGYTTILAHSSRQALEELTKPVDLVLIDAMMQGMDGFELTRHIRASHRHSDLPLIMVTALSSKDDRLAAVEAGVNDFISKPIDPAELRIRIAALLRLHASERAARDYQRQMEQNLRVHLEEIRSYNAVLEKKAAELEAANARLETLATTDVLTGLKNRGYVLEALDRAYCGARRYGHALSVLLMDVDRFKEYNDTFGHLAGDEVLRAVAWLLRTHSRDSDIVGRFGGEEFLLVLPHTDAGGSQEAAERMRVGLEMLPWPQRPVTASIGAATLSRETVEPIELVRLADLALYRAKHQGRNRVAFGAEQPTIHNQG